MKSNKEVTLKNSCGTIDDLNSYLRRKAGNHNNFKYYSSLSRIINIRDSKKLYLNNGKNWNDIIDRNSFNSDDNTYVNFGKCFSFSRDENVAMWMLYGGINKLSGMVDFTKKGMQSILETAYLNVGYFDDNATFKTVKKLTRDEFEIYLTDVVYYSKNGKKYYINRAEESFESLSGKVFDELKSCKKTYPWKYENECRLIVSVNKEYLEDNCDIVQIDLEKLDLGKSLERIYRGPNYPLENTQNTLPSQLDNAIDWTLCDGKNCINHKGE